MFALPEVAAVLAEATGELAAQHAGVLVCRLARNLNTVVNILPQNMSVNFMDDFLL